MTALKINPNFPLELLNGAGGIPETIFIFVLGLYLFREARRRQLGLRSLVRFQYPPSMNLAVAVLVFDIGVCTRSWTIWIWRQNGAGAFDFWQIAALAIGGALIAVGGVCKVRSLTLPDYGHIPWVMTALAIGIFVGVSLSTHTVRW